MSKRLIRKKMKKKKKNDEKYFYYLLIFKTTTTKRNDILMWTCQQDWSLASGLKQNQWQFIEIFSAFCSDLWELHCFLLIYNRFLDNIYNKHKNNSKICNIFRWHPLVPHFCFNDLVCFRLFYHLYFWIETFLFS